MTGTRIAIFGHLPPLPIVIDEPYHYDEIAFGLLFLFTIDLDIYISLSLLSPTPIRRRGEKERGNNILFYSFRRLLLKVCHY